MREKLSKGFFFPYRENNQSKIINKYLPLVLQSCKLKLTNGLRKAFLWCCLVFNFPYLCLACAFMMHSMQLWLVLFHFEGRFKFSFTCALFLQFEAGLYPTAKVVYATYALSEFLGKAPAITEVGILSYRLVMIAITEHTVFMFSRW